MRPRALICVLILALVLLPAGCRYIAWFSPQPQEQTDHEPADGPVNTSYTVLQPPVRDGDGFGAWYLTQAFGAFYSDRGGSHPAEDWSCAAGNADAGAPVYAITPGEVVAVGAVNADGGQGFYMILRHSGSFLIHESAGPHLLSSAQPMNEPGRGSNGGSAVAYAADVFTYGGWTDYRFDAENRYGYPEQVSDTIYSVYMHINRPDLRVGDRVEDVNVPIATLAALDTGNAHLHFEIRDASIENFGDAGLAAVINHESNGYFIDSQLMAALGYREPSAVIQASWGLGDGATVIEQTPAPTPTPASTEAAVHYGPPATVQISTLAYSNDYIDVSMEIPVICGLLDEALQAGVNAAIADECAAIAHEIEQISTDQYDSYGDLRQLFIYSGCTVWRNDGAVLSIAVRMDFDAGGANCGSDSRFINILNMNPGQELILADLFVEGSGYIEVLNSLVNDQISANPDLSLDSWFQTVTDDQWFYLRDDRTRSLVIVFPAYSITAGIYGEAEFAIPLQTLYDCGVLRPEYLPQ